MKRSFRLVANMSIGNQFFVSIAALLSFISPVCRSQNGFSTGFKGGSGIGIFPVDPVFKSNAKKHAVQMNPQVHTGVVVQYEIAEKAGIESGFQLMYYTYSFKDRGTYFKKYFNQATAITVTDFQIPVLLTYNMHHRYNASRYFKIAAGTSLDCFSSNLFIMWGPVVSVKNIILSVRAGKVLEYGKLEFALEHQYSMNRYSVNGTNYDQLNDRITTRTSFFEFQHNVFSTRKREVYNFVRISGKFV